MDNEITQINCELIGFVGEAKSCFVEALDLALEGKKEEALNAIKEGRKAFNEGHKVHAKLLTKMANGEKVEMDLLAVHAQCQMMSAEDFMILAQKAVGRL